MEDIGLYQQILGLAAPWKVGRVELKLQDQEVNVWVEHSPEAAFVCPACGKACGLYDHAAQRSWRHLDTCQFKTYLHARIPRVNCPEHGVVNVDVPWGAKSSRFTLLMERLIIDLLGACQNIQSVCRLIGIGWEAVASVMERAVARGQKRKAAGPIRYLGVDEKSFKKGQHYITVVSDLDKGAVEYVAEHRSAESLAGYYRRLSPEQLAGIEAVAMDMSWAYEQATRTALDQPQRKIVFDRFHVMKSVSDALDRIRRQENFQLTRRHDDTLARTRQMWLWSQENLPEKYTDLLNRLKNKDLRTAKAWALKEHLRRLWDQPDLAKARRFFNHWYRWVQKTKLLPMINVAQNLKARLEQIINYSIHPITTAGCEGLNSKISSVKIRAAGFRNLERFKTAILFYCGKLDLYP